MLAIERCVRRKIPMFYVAYGLYALSLVLPAVVFMDRPLFGSGDGHEKALLGFHCLVIGWVAMPTWIANPLFAAAGIFHAYHRYTIARVLSALSVIAALLSFLFLGPELRYMHVGYYVWVAAMIAMLVASAKPRDSAPIPLLPPVENRPGGPLVPPDHG